MNHDPVHVEILDIDDTEALVVWSFMAGSPPMTARIELTFERADPSVGIMSAAFTADGDCPDAVLDEVAEAAMLRAVEHYEEDEPDDYRDDPDDRDPPEEF